MINIAKNNTNQHNHDELKIFQDYKWLIVICNIYAYIRKYFRSGHFNETMDFE